MAKTVFGEAVDLMAGNDTGKDLYDRAAENLGVPAEKGRDAVRAWFRERGYVFEGRVPVLDEGLRPGVYILVEDDLYRCAYNPEDLRLMLWPDAEGGTRLRFDELADTGWAMTQFVWDEGLLWLIKVAFSKDSNERF